MYQTYSDVIFGWVVWIKLSITDSVLGFFFAIDLKVAGLGRGARRPTPAWFFNFTIHREKVKILRKKVQETQANPSYSAKNNVAIRVIATFMPKTYGRKFTCFQTASSSNERRDILILITIFMQFFINHCSVSNVMSNWFINQKSLCLLYILLILRLSDYFTTRWKLQWSHVFLH